MRTVMEVAEKIGFQPDASFEKFDEIATRFPDNVKKALDYHLKILSQRKYLQFDPSESYLFMMLVYDFFLPQEFAMLFRKLAETKKYEINLPALTAYRNQRGVSAINKWLDCYDLETSIDPLFWWSTKPILPQAECALQRFPYLLFIDVFERALSDRETEPWLVGAERLWSRIADARVATAEAHHLPTDELIVSFLCLGQLFEDAGFDTSKSIATRTLLSLYKKLPVDFSQEPDGELETTVKKLKILYTNGLQEALEDDSFMKNKLLTEQGYMPYCGGTTCTSFRRTRFNGMQFVANCCHWTSGYSDAFIKRYKEKWNLK